MEKNSLNLLGLTRPHHKDLLVQLNKEFCHFKIKNLKTISWFCITQYKINIISGCYKPVIIWQSLISMKYLRPKIRTSNYMDNVTACILTLWFTYQCCLHRRLQCSIIQSRWEGCGCGDNELAPEFNGQYTVQKTQGLKYLLLLCMFLASNFKNVSVFSALQGMKPNIIFRHQRVNCETKAI